MSRKVRLIAERSVIYAPHHVAVALGFFGDEGLEVETNYDSGPGGSWLADTLVDGAADLARGGIWLPILYRRRIADLRLISLLCDRNPQVFLARKTSSVFEIRSIEGALVLLPSAATSQWMFLRGVLQERAVDVSATRFIRDLEASTMARLWRAGFGDYILTNPPLADSLIEMGYSIAGTMAEMGGRVPWSVYYASHSFLESNREVAVAFVRALVRAQRWMQARSSRQVTALIAEDFPEIAPLQLESAVERMMKTKIWTGRAELSPEPLSRYQEFIVQYGLTDHALPYSELVEYEIAAEAEAAA